MAALADRIAAGAAWAVVVAFVISFVAGVYTRDETEPAGEPAVQPTVPEPAGPGLGTVEVLNAARIPGLARRATQQLRDAGFDVVFYGNAASSVDNSSVVIDRMGDIEVARAAAASLGISRVDAALDSGLLVSATVIVGGDWVAGATPAEGSVEATASDKEPSWLRRMFERIF